METYETARIAIVDIEEDVIAASGVSCERTFLYIDHGDPVYEYVLHFPDGTSQEFGPGLSAIDADIPEEYQYLCD